MISTSSAASIRAGWAQVVDLPWQRRAIVRADNPDSRSASRTTRRSPRWCARKSKTSAAVISTGIPTGHREERLQIEGHRPQRIRPAPVCHEPQIPVHQPVTQPIPACPDPTRCEQDKGRCSSQHPPSTARKPAEATDHRCIKRCALGTRRNRCSPIVTATAVTWSAQSGNVQWASTTATAPKPKA